MSHKDAPLTLTGVNQVPTDRGNKQSGSFKGKIISDDTPPT
jgi:hypothetical protein